MQVAVDNGRITFRFRHCVNELTIATGVDFTLRAQAVIVTSGGIGANHDLVRANWPPRLGTAPASMLSGVPDYVDGRMLAVSESAGGRIINRDRMWHYTEGIQN